MSHPDRLHTTIADDLASVLDVDAGLREALVAAQHRRTRHGLALDIEAGLHAIAAAPPEVPATSPTTTWQPAAAPHNTELRGEVATWLMSQGSARRLALRQHPAIAAFAVSAEINAAAAIALDIHGSLGGTCDLALVRANASLLVATLDRARDLANDLDRISTSVRALVQDLVSANNLANNLADDLNLARHLEIDFAHFFTLCRNTACNRALELANNLDNPLHLAAALTRILSGELAPHLAPDLANHIAIDYASFHDQALAHDLDRARHDFTAADLSTVDLSRVSLTGIRWSMATRWPSDGWREQALLDSDLLSDGTYQIRGGTTHAPIHSR